ncbi:hypothetical protein [Ponticaulis sp.]|uniref:hypothetical protein n=1 Tax=Ponticaulis sp. TaxID=2020902 RepID=UPI00261D64BE|nr:hypothetical protein [Ponticaulis sp.]MDF1680420.1 hypothetical protein [Ponticaulis sp.]
MSVLISQIERETRSLIGSFSSNLGYEIRLPLIYSNGEMVSVVVDERDDCCLVHDAGFAAMTLSASGQTMTQRIEDRVKAYASTMECHFERGRVWRKVSKDQATAAVLSVGSVCRYIADQASPDTKKRAEFEVRVNSVLQKMLGEDRISWHQKVTGKSGGTYDVTAAIIELNTKQPKALIEAIGSARAVPHRFRHLYEIKSSQRYRNVDLISVYDDQEVFESSDIVLLQDVSNAVPYSSFERRVKQYA